LVGNRKAVIIVYKYIFINDGKGKMGIIGFIFSLVAAGFMLIGLLPFLGWLNWVTTLPAAVAGAVLSGIDVSRSKGGIGAAGLIISLIVFVIGVGRLVLGCGAF
jgi:hypothetical protein